MFRLNNEGTRVAPIHTVSRCVQMIMQQLHQRMNSGIVLLHDYSSKKEVAEFQVAPEHVKILDIVSLLVSELRTRNIAFEALRPKIE
jgi:hypothetical protein